MSLWRDPNSKATGGLYGCRRLDNCVPGAVVEELVRSINMFLIIRFGVHESI